MRTVAALPAFVAALSVFGIAAVASTAAAFAPPPGWSAGAPTRRAEHAGDPMCCALGKFHPCCGNQRLFNRGKANRVAELVEVDLASLPVVDMTECTDRFAEDSVLPVADQDAATYGLGVYVAGKPRSLLGLALDDHVRLMPDGDFVGIRAQNAGYWGGGASGTFSKHFSSPPTAGVAFMYGSPRKRVDRLTFDSITLDDGSFTYRFFNGAFDKVTGEVGASCFYTVTPRPLLDRWIYGFIGDRNGRRELHLIMPEGERILSSGLAPRVTFDPLFDHQVVSLEGTHTVATRAGADRWQHVDSRLAGTVYFGTLSVHVSSAKHGPNVLVARGHTRPPVPFF